MKLMKIKPNKISLQMIPKNKKQTLQIINIETLNVNNNKIKGTNIEQ